MSVRLAGVNIAVDLDIGQVQNYRPYPGCRSVTKKNLAKLKLYHLYLFSLLMDNFELVGGTCHNTFTLSISMSNFIHTSV